MLYFRFDQLTQANGCYSALPWNILIFLYNYFHSHNMKTNLAEFMQCVIADTDYLSWEAKSIGMQVHHSIAGSKECQNMNYVIDPKYKFKPLLAIHFYTLDLYEYLYKILIYILYHRHCMVYWRSASLETLTRCHLLSSSSMVSVTKVGRRMSSRTKTRWKQNHYSWN